MRPPMNWPCTRTQPPAMPSRLPSETSGYEFKLQKCLGSDYSVLRIVQIGFGELDRTNRNLLSDGENLHIGSAFFDKGIDAHIDVDSLVLRQPRNFPQADRRKSKRPGFAGPPGLPSLLLVKGFRGR